MAGFRLQQPAFGVAAMATGFAMLALCASSAAWAFDYQDVVAQAQALSRKPHQQPEAISDGQADLTYDQYRAIHFKTSHQLWPQRAFHVQFFALGSLYTHPVKIHIIDKHDVHRQAFHRAAFATGKAYPEDEKLAQGFAGFRLHWDGYHADDSIAEKNNEVIVFLGASYFRAKAAGQEYGTSARGLAIDTIAPKAEEFPAFRAFWIRKPAPGEDSVVVYALMDSPSVTGAYRFKITPGKPAHVDVRATVFMRHSVHQLGLVPLSSMYFYGVGNHRLPAYLRPAVHDAQGLLLADGHNRWTWRPLANPQSVKEYSFSLQDPRGFGLMQRDRDFFDYQSISMAYQARPSVWIQPKNDWGAGQVRLVEIPTEREYNDNIAVFWTPETQPKPHQAFHFAYRMTWGDKGPPEPVERVRRTLSTRRGLDQPTKFTVDFAGGALAGSSEGATLKPVVQVGDHGELAGKRVRYLRATNTYRLQFTVRPTANQPIQLRAYLSRDGQAVTETWDYVITPRDKQ